jgi:hypothetical protein
MTATKLSDGRHDAAFDWHYFYTAISNRPDVRGNYAPTVLECTTENNVIFLNPMLRLTANREAVIPRIRLSSSPRRRRVDRAEVYPI